MSVMTEPRSRDRRQAGAATPVLEPTYEGDFVLDEHLLLECGRTLAGLTLHYAVYGRLNAARDNAVLVCHALSGSALVGSWWPEIFAPGAVLSLDHDFVICINMLGSCYGSTGPGSVDPETGESLWPGLSSGFDPRQCAGAGAAAGFAGHPAAAAGSGRLHRGHAGPGLGHPLSPSAWSGRLIIGVTPLSAMGLALNHLQRQAIQHDPEWAGGHYLPQRPPRRGLALARQIAMLSYKSAALFDERFGAQPQPQRRGSMGAGRPGRRPDRRALRHCRLSGPPGRALHRPLRRQCLSGHSAHHGHLGPAARLFLGRRRPSAASAPGSVLWASARIGCFLPHEVREFACTIRAAGVQADYREMTSAHGHDAFLAEQAELVRLLQ